jgi:hypothetical protein
MDTAARRRVQAMADDFTFDTIGQDCANRKEQRYKRDKYCRGYEHDHPPNQEVPSRDESD